MPLVETPLAFSGLALFVFGLAIGFAIRALPNPRLALSAHLNAVQSGTFLMVLGLLWPRLAVWKRAAGALSLAVWLSFLALEAGMVLAALVPAEASRPPRALKAAATGLQAIGAVVMLAAVGVLLFAFKSPATAVAGDARPPARIGSLG